MKIHDFLQFRCLRMRLDLKPDVCRTGFKLLFHVLHIETNGAKFSAKYVPTYILYISFLPFLYISKKSFYYTSAFSKEGALRPWVLLQVSVLSFVLLLSIFFVSLFTPTWDRQRLRRTTAAQPPLSPRRRRRDLARAEAISAIITKQEMAKDIHL